MQELIELMRRLRDPEHGCPWDRRQSFETIAPYTIEEAYEVADAITRKDLAGLKDELGDLLFQVVFHARLAEEQGHFQFDDVARAIVEKMVRRHPHVFEESDQSLDDDALRASWEAIKAAERRGADPVGTQRGVLEGVARGLPALVRAQKLQRRAAAVGFDWPVIWAVWDKLEEERAELEAEVEHFTQGDEAGREAARARLSDELGDLLFTCVNLARHAEVDADRALREANRRFEARFIEMERLSRTSGQTLEALSEADWDALWESAKQQISSGPPVKRQ